MGCLCFFDIGGYMGIEELEGLGELEDLEDLGNLEGLEDLENIGGGSRMARGTRETRFCMV